MVLKGEEGRGNKIKIIHWKIQMKPIISNFK